MLAVELRDTVSEKAPIKYKARGTLGKEGCNVTHRHTQVLVRQRKALKLSVREHTPTLAFRTMRQKTELLASWGHKDRLCKMSGKGGIKGLELGFQLVIMNSVICIITGGVKKVFYMPL